MPKIVVYTSPTCGFCQKAKRFMEKHQIPYTEIDAGSPEGRSGLERLNSRSVPTILVEDQVIIGFQEQRLMNLLGIRILLPY